MYQSAATSERPEQQAGARQQQQPYEIGFMELTRDHREAFIFYGDRGVLGETLGEIALSLRNQPSLFFMADAEVVASKHGIRVKVFHPDNWPDAMTVIKGHLPEGLPAVRLSGDVPSSLAALCISK